MANRERNRVSADSLWHGRSVRWVADAVCTDPGLGLSSSEVVTRLERDGPNVITVRRGAPWWLRLLRQFHAPLIYILLVATLVTLLVEEYLDSAVIFGVVLVNAVIGFVEESRAVRAIDALARSMRFETVVRREGRRRRIDAAEVVVGDVVVLEAGDRVPADLRIISTRELCCDESALTGESEPVSKREEEVDATAVLADRVSMAYASSLVTRGVGEGIVVAIGDRTEVGRISGLIATVDRLQTPLNRKIAAFSRVLLAIILGIATLMFAIGLSQGRGLIDTFMATVAMAVGAIPEGLPAAFTIMLAVGVSRMARRNAIIRRLPAVEALGSTTVICSDKTGTLTQNQMTVRNAWVASSERAGLEYEFTGSGYDPSGEVRVSSEAGPAGAAVTAGDHPTLAELLRCGLLCNDSEIHEPDAGTDAMWSVRGDPTEAALIVSARKLARSDQSLLAEWPRRDAIQFDSDRQYMATLHDAAGDRDHPVVFVKGSVERVLDMCRDIAMRDGQRAELDAEVVHGAADRLASRGLRVLAFAMGEWVAGGGENGAERSFTPGSIGGNGRAVSLTFLGLQGMLDPPRQEALDAVRVCREAGISVKMITGDHASTASSIAAMMGIGDEPRTALTGAELARQPDEAMPHLAESVSVFARMTPEQKLRLVRALQSRGNIVAMTGDGVNDAPALRQADIGVAMGIAGTEAAKDAADIVLADDNFASIAAAVEEGRTVYTNLIKFIVWTLPTNGAEALVILSAIVLNWPLPILPVQALYINMFTAILLGLPLIFEDREPDQMDRPPRDPAKPLFSTAIFMRTCFVSLMLTVGAMLLFHEYLRSGRTEESARTAAVLAIVVGKVFYLFNSRALLRSAWSTPLWSNRWLWIGIAAMLAVQGVFTYSPIVNRLFQTESVGLDAWAWSAIIGVIAMLLVEVEKAIRRALGSHEDL